MNIWLWIILITTIILLLIYIIGSIKSEGSLVKSLYAQNEKSIVADQIYYLPTAYLLIKATAKVIVAKNATTSNITDVKLAELALDTTVQTVPDTRNAFSLNYTSSWFSNDDLKLSINSSGLIEGINLTAEDRISNIVSQISEAPKIILTGEQAVASKSAKTGEGTTEEGEVVITETKEYTNNFLILTDEIRNKTASRVWKINVDGTTDNDTTVDASFDLRFNIPSPESLSFGDGVKEFDGVLTRPLQTITMEIYKYGALPAPEASPTPDVKYQIVIPDESRVVSIPIKRSAFVRKVYGFKMMNGMLTENVINKPSETEGLLSIPINIAKAIVSIPAQLLHFKIENIKRQISLETERQNFAKAELQTKKDEISREADLLKSKLDTQKTVINYEGEIAKTKLEAEKTLLEAQKNVVTANKDLSDAKKDWENAKKELEELLKKIQEEHERKYKDN